MCCNRLHTLDIIEQLAHPLLAAFAHFDGDGENMRQITRTIRTFRLIDLILIFAQDFRPDVVVVEMRKKITIIVVVQL